MENKEKQPWERQPGEPALWFDRFECYRALGPTRTYQGAFDGWFSRQYPPRKHARVPHPTWYERAQQWHWKERAAEWDNWQWQERVLMEQEAIREMTKRHVNLGMEMQEVGGTALSKAEEVGVGDARLLIKDGADLERRARGLPDYLLEISGMTDEELLAEYERVVAQETARNST